MGFLTPWFLGGLLALGLPVYLHLLRRTQRKQRPFASLMMFERRPHSSVRRRRISFWPLFLLRLALLLLLALAFANPYVRRDALPTRADRKLVVVALDQSFSMRHGDRFARAQQDAQRLVESMRSGDLGQVVLLGPQARLATQPTADKAALRSALQAAAVGDSQGAYADLARAVRLAGQSTKLPVEVHLFSDLQRSGLPGAFSDLALPIGASLVPHSVATAADRNWFVESLTAPRVVYTDRKVRVQATVTGANTDAARRTATLSLNGRDLDSKVVDVPANGRATVEFLNLDVPHGLNRAEVRLDSADRLAQDDRFPFSIERGDPRRLLFVGNTRSQLYVESALESASDRAFTLQPATPDQLGSLSLRDYALVLLSDVGVLPGSAEAALTQYVNGGGSLLVALGPAAIRRSTVPVMGNSVKESVYSPRSGERFRSVSYMDAEHPSARRANRWEGVKFYQAARLDPAGARVIARLGDDTPLLLEKRVGEGKVLAFASTFDNISNDFPIRPAFVPFIEQTAFYLAGVEDRQANVPVDTFLELRSSADRGSSVEVLDPDNRRALQLAEAANAQTFQVTREGYYEVRRGSGRNELVAVHANRAESDLTPIPPETLALWRGTGEPQSASAAPGAEQSDAERVSPLWWYFVCALLAVALAESVFASRYLAVEKESA